MKQKYIGACLLVVGAILILYGNWSLLPAPFDIPKSSVTFSIPADGSSYTGIETIQIIVAIGSGLDDPTFLKTIMYNDTAGTSIQLSQDPTLLTRWIGIPSLPLRVVGSYHFWFTFVSWEGFDYPWPNGVAGGTYTITSTQPGDGTDNSTILPSGWVGTLVTVSGIAFIESGIIMIVRRRKNE